MYHVAYYILCGNLHEPYIVCSLYLCNASIWHSDCW